MTNRTDLTRYARLSIAAAVLTIVMKGAAYWLTGSVGLLSDALESVINLVAAVMVLAALLYAARPPDDSHEFGHDKIEYFAGGIEGTLIVVAALTIGWAALGRLIEPEPLERIDLGLILSGAASAVNLVIGRILIRAGKRHNSMTLRADGQHLMADVWTSVGVVVGLVAAALTGQLWLDALAGLLVAGHILATGARLMRQAFDGLMDSPLDPDGRAEVDRILAAYRAEGIEFHALRTRKAAARCFLSVHVLVPPRWTVQHGHDLLERLEADLRAAVPNLSTLTHLEPIGDPASLDDVPLDRS